MAALVNHIRVVNRYLQTPIRAYRNERGRTVWLVGLVHNGERRYFQQIKGIVLGLQQGGAAVHYEHTAMTPEEVEAAGLTDNEREAIDLVLRRDQTSLDLYAPWGWIDQLIGFGGRWPEGWEQHDLRLIEIIRLRGVETTIADARATHAAIRAAGGSRLARRQYLMEAVLDYWNLALGVRLPKPTDATILVRRNDKAINDADAVAGDVVLLWGASHLDGLEDRLQARGYAMVEETWHSVGRIPHHTTVLAWTLVFALINLRRLPQRIRLMKAQYQANKPYLAEVKKELAEKE